MIKYFLFTVTLFCCFYSVSPSLGNTGNEWGPWDRDRTFESRPSHPQPARSGSKPFATITTFPARLLITFFQKVISPVDGPTCTFYPTCSAYAKQALQKHGLFTGLVMTSERVNRYHSPEGYELILKYGQYYLYDPVENNDFWFHRHKDSTP